MGELRDKKIVQSRNWLDPDQLPIPPFDFDFVYPITVFDAVKRNMDDNSSNLTDELESIYRLIADKQDIIQAGLPGNIMTWSGVKGQIGALEVIKSINGDPSLRSHQKIPTEKAIGDSIDTRAPMSALNSHINDNSIHTTDIERTRWNSMAPLSSLQAHIGNTNMHIGNDERVRWNGKADQTEVDQHIYDTNNPHNVTAHQAGTYTRREVDDLFEALRESFFNYLNIMWDDRTNQAELVKYHPANWNPNYILGFNDSLPDVPNPSLTYFALKPVTDYLINETQDVIIYIKRPGLMWQEVGFANMNPGDMIIRYPDTAMFVWVQGRFLRVLSNNAGEDSLGGDGLNGNVWKPSIDSEGIISWDLSDETTAPSSFKIKGDDGYTPIKGVDYVDGVDGKGVAVGGEITDLLVKLSNENYDTTWKSLPDLFDDLTLSGWELPDGLVKWDKINGRPEWYKTLGPNDDGFITQKAVSKEFDIRDIIIGDIQALLDGPGGLDGIRQDIYEHINDFTNPHKVSASLIGAVPVSSFNNHLNDFANPHSVTKSQIGLGNVDNTTDVNKPISTAVQLALDELNDKIILLGGAGVTCVVNVAWNNTSGTLTFTFNDDSVLNIPIPIADIFNNIYFDSTTKELVIVLPNGTENRININALIQLYYGSIGTHIQVIVEDDNIIKANIIPSSIGDTELVPSIHLKQSPTTTTQPVSDKSNRIATTEYVKTQVINNLISYEAERPLSANMGRILNDRKADIDDVINLILDLEGFTVIDHLESTSAVAGLSANMGRYLDTTKAPRVHTSPSGSTFGRATSGVFGHTRSAETEPEMDGTVFIGTDDGFYARADHRHPNDITRAPIDSPEFIGIPKAPTPADDSSDDQIATTAWVRQNGSGAMHGECTTAGDISIKVATLRSSHMIDPTFIRQIGSMVCITFDNEDDSAATTMLDVQNTGPAPILYGGLPLENYMIGSACTHAFSFDGVNWRLLNPEIYKNVRWMDDDEIHEFAGDGITGFVGFTSAYNTSDANGEVTKVVFNVSFCRQRGSAPSVVLAGTFKALLGDDTSVVLSSPEIVSVTRFNAMISFTLATSFAHSSPCILVLDPASSITISSIGPDQRIIWPDDLEVFAAGAGDVSDFKGITLARDNTADINGDVTRMFFTVPFKDIKSVLPTVSVNGSFNALMGDGTTKALTSPSVVVTTCSHAVIRFDCPAHPMNNIGYLVYDSIESTITVTPTAINVKDRTGYETFTGGGNDVISEFVGFTTTRNNTSNANGEVNRVVFGIPFKDIKPTTTPTISVTGDFKALMGDNTLIDLVSPTLLDVSDAHAVYMFTMQSLYPANSPCHLVYATSASEINVAPL